MTEADEPPPEDTTPSQAQRDMLLRHYPLRDLLWCGECDLPLTAILVPPGARYYGCASKHSDQRLLPADIAQQRVWSRFVAINQLLAEGIPRDQRHHVLRELVKRVVVGPTTADLTFEWRD